jgi:hypothetical protein
VQTKQAGGGVPSRTATVCSPGWKSSTRQVAARGLRGQAGKKHPNCCWPGPIGVFRAPFLLVPDSQLRRCWACGPLPFNKNTNSIFFLRTNSTPKQLRTCEGWLRAVLRTTVDMLSADQPAIIRTISTSISGIGMSSLASARETNQINAQCNTAFHLPGLAQEPHKTTLSNRSKVVEWSIMAIARQAMPFPLSSTDSNGVRVDPQTKPPLHPNRPYGSKHSKTRARSLIDIKTPTL